MLLDHDEATTVGLGTCALCGREEDLTRHHLIPRARHRKARTMRRFARHEMKGNIVMLCIPCHKNVHRVLTERELAEDFPTLELLRENSDVAKFTNWIKPKPTGFRPPGL